MLSKQQLSFVRSLHQKKFRQMYGKFLVEGDKPVRELLASDYKIESIFKVKRWNEGFDAKKAEVFEVSEQELRKISTHETPNQVIAIAKIPDSAFSIQHSALEEGLYLACDQLNDPGNAGTIIRIADWFGIKKVFLSENSVDIFNPKVVSAAKGSLFRTQCMYADLRKLFEANKHTQVFGTFMNGESIYTAALDKSAFILIGNEANGISPELFPFIQHKISIPSFGNAESLNAAVAAGIVVSEFRRRG